MSAALATKVEELSKTVRGMNTSLQKMDGHLKEIYVAMVGNKEFGQEGLISRVEDLEDTRDKWKTKVNWMYGYVFGLSTLGTLLIEFIKSKI